MRAIWNIAVKDLLLLWRDRAGLFWVLGFPLLMALFFGSIFSGSDSPGPITVGLVDQDTSTYSRAFVAELGKTPSLKLRPTTIDSARQLVRGGKLSAYLSLKKGFGASYGLAFSKKDTLIEMGVDPSRAMLAGMLEGLITQALFTTVGTQLLNPQNVSTTVDQWMAGIAQADDLSPKEKDAYTGILRNWKQVLPSESTKTAGGGMSLNNIVLIKKTDMSSTEAGPRTSFEVTFPQSVFWALIGCCGAFAVSLVVERTRGTLVRLRLAPITRTQLLAGKGLACFVASMVVAVGLMLFGAIVFKIRVLSLPLLILAIMAASSCFVGLMMSISVIGRTEQAVGGAAWAILLIFSMIGGGMLPLMFMPGWLQALSNISPVKWGILAVEGAVWRGFTFTEMLFPVGILFALGIVFFSLGAWVLTKREL